MRSKPSGGLWLIWLTAYSVLDMVLAALLHGSATWGQLPGAIEGALFAATLTWVWALRRWYEADDSY